MSSVTEPNGKKEQMEYRETVDISKADVERWNFLLSKDIDEMTETETEQYKAKPYDSEGGYYIEFADGSNVTIDLCSGSQNYYDEAIWHNADNSQDITFDCNYEIGKEPEELEVGNNLYVIEWNVGD